MALTPEQKRKLIERIKILKESGVSGLAMADLINTLENKIKGEKGEPGKSVTGRTGLMGPKGEKGEPGKSVTGRTGLMGPKGERGEQGPQGIPGINATGYMGAQGPRGNDGKDGKDAAAITGEQIIQKILSVESGAWMPAEMIKDLPTVTRELPTLSIFGRGRGLGAGARLEVAVGGVSYGQDIRKLLFTGSGVSATRNADGVVTINITGGGGAVSSVSNSDGTLTISPTLGAVVASLALGHANTWTGLQTFIATNDATKGLVVKAFSNAQSANTFEVHNFDGEGSEYNSLYVDSAGILSFGPSPQNDSGIFKLARSASVDDYTFSFPSNAGNAGDGLFNQGAGATSWQPIAFLNSPNVFTQKQTIRPTGSGEPFLFLIGSTGATTVYNQLRLGLEYGTDYTTLKINGSIYDTTNKYTRTSFIVATNNTDQEFMVGESRASAPAIGFLGATAVLRQTGNIGTALVNLGLMSGTPTFGAGNLTGTTLASSVVTSSLTTVGTIGAGVWQGTKIGLAYGGTNADLSGTGGTSQVLKQTSVGGAITVAQLAASDLSNGVTGSGAVVLAVSPALTGVPTAPTAALGDNSTQIATTAFVQAALSSFDSKQQVAYASTSPLPANTYNNGTSGVGATLTGNSNGPLIIDGVTILVAQAGEDVLVAGESTAANNGWYRITQVGVIAVSPYILTRRITDDQSAEIGSGYLTSVIAPNGVTAGSSNNGKVFISVAAADPFVVGTTNLTFSQVGSTYSAGNGLTLSGTAFSIDTSVTVDKTTAQTLSNKTFVAPALGTPASGVGTNLTGIPAAAILAGSFGAGAYVISTSLQVATLELGHATDTTISRVSAGLIAVEGITLVDVSTAQTLTNKLISTGSAMAESLLTLTDITTNNVSTSKHGFAPKLPNDATKYLDGTGAYTVPAGGGGGTTIPQTNNLRLTLTTAVPVTTSDVTGATTIYLTNFNGSYIATYDSSTWTLHSTAEVSIALGTLTNAKLYDVFAYYTGSVVALEFSAAWTNDTTRADALALQDGVYVKSSDHSRRYLGTFRTTATTTTEDSLANRNLWNYQNQVQRAVYVSETGNWSLGANTVFSQRGSKQAGGVFGLSIGAVHLTLSAFISPPGGTGGVLAIGVDSTSTPSGITPQNNTGGVLSAILDQEMTLGYHYFAWLECALGGTVNFYATDTPPAKQFGGISGFWMA